MPLKTPSLPVRHRSPLHVVCAMAMVEACCVSGALAQEPAPPVSEAVPTNANPTDSLPPVPLAGVDVSGNTVIPTIEIAAVVRKTFGNQVATRTLLQHAVDAVLALYRKRGYTMAQVTDAEILPSGRLHLTIGEGVIRQVVIRGNTRTRTHTVLQVITSQPGHVYNDTAIRRDRMRLGRLGIFADISVAPRVPGTEEEPIDKEPGSNGTEKKNPTGTGTETAKPSVTEPTTVVPLPAQPIVPPDDAVGQVDLVIRVKDQPTVNVAATVGYADSIGAVGFLDLSENNLLGTGHRISVEWQRSAQTAINDDGTLTTTSSRSAAGFSYEVPPLGTRSLAFGLDIYNRNTVFLPYFAGGRETIRSYERRSGARTRMGKLFSDVFSGFITLRRDIVGYDPIPESLSPPAADVASAAGTVGAVGLDLVADGRDAIDVPQQGYRYELQVERAANILGGNRAFTQTVLDLRRYAPVLHRTTRPRPAGSKVVLPVIATRVMGGYSTGVVPLSEQFFLGGFDLLRGYDLFSIRGDRFFLSTAEVRVPVGPGLQAVGFTDIGTAWLPGARASLNDLRASIGLGLRFISPIGPIRFDAALGSRVQTYISLGQSF